MSSLDRYLSNRGRFGPSGNETSASNQRKPRQVVRPTDASNLPHCSSLVAATTNTTGARWTSQSCWTTSPWFDCYYITVLKKAREVGGGIPRTDSRQTSFTVQPEDVRYRSVCQQLSMLVEQNSEGSIKKSSSNRLAPDDATVRISSFSRRFGQEQFRLHVEELWYRNDRLLSEPARSFVDYCDNTNTSQTNSIEDFLVIAIDRLEKTWWHTSCS